MALLVLAACEQVDRALGSALSRRKAIAELNSRIIVYRFLADIFEVLDGNDAKRLGWECPYFCNVMHAPSLPGK